MGLVAFLNQWKLKADDVIFYFFGSCGFEFVTAQLEAGEDPLENITTAEVIQTLIDSYCTSQHCYAVREKVEEMSKYVSC